MKLSTSRDLHRRWEFEIISFFFCLFFFVHSAKKIYWFISTSWADDFIHSRRNEQCSNNVRYSNFRLASLSKVERHYQNLRFVYAWDQVAAETCGKIMWKSHVSTYGAKHWSSAAVIEKRENPKWILCLIENKFSKVTLLHFKGRIME